MDKSNQITVPIYQLDEDGYVLPNPLFHRAWDKFHSRCVEYPFAASHLGLSKKILDIGSAKSDPLWLQWLDSLPIEVHAIDFDSPPRKYQNISFHKSDVRNIPFNDNTFEKVFAISVIEHIGMEDPQVGSMNLPSFEKDGDSRAIEELIRVLKPGGEIVMTIPFGNPKVVATDNSIRIYTAETINKFEEFATLISLDYYEYQYIKYRNLYPEFSRKKRKIHQLKDIFFEEKEKPLIPIDEKLLPKHFGIVTWRRMPLEYAESMHYGHTDGVVCGIWKK